MATIMICDLHDGIEKATEMYFIRDPVSHPGKGQKASIRVDVCAEHGAPFRALLNGILSKHQDSTERRKAPYAEQKAAKRGASTPKLVYSDCSAALQKLAFWPRRVDHGKTIYLLRFNFNTILGTLRFLNDGEPKSGLQIWAAIGIEKPAWARARKAMRDTKCIESTGERAHMRYRITPTGLRVLKEIEGG